MCPSPSLQCVSLVRFDPMTYTHSLIRTVSTQSQAGRARTKIAKMQEARARGAISEGSRLERRSAVLGMAFIFSRCVRGLTFRLCIVIAGM